MNTGRIVVLAALFALSPAACSTRSGAPSSPSPWHAAPPLPVPRFEAYAAVAYGRAYFIGGITGVEGDIRTAQPSRRVDVFDPATQAWSSAPDLPGDAPKHHLTVTVWNDSIYVLGGFDGILGRDGAPFVPVAVAYALGGGPGASWRKLAPPPLARGGATAQAIDGLLYVTGGAPNEGEPSYAQLDVYDVSADRWSTRTPMPTPREHVASCAVSGTMMVVGGWRDIEQGTQSGAEEYDPKLDRWTRLPDLPTGRGGLGAVAIGSACHVVGGEDWRLPPPGTFATHDVFDSVTGTWSSGAPMPTARHGLGLAWLDGTLYAIGGGPRQGNSYTAIVEVLTP